jgi:Cysteine dioxygenase type I
MLHPSVVGTANNPAPSLVAGGLRATADRDELLATAYRYAARPDEWPVEPRFDPRRRWYHRIAEEADAEIWLLSWLPGQQTELHDHAGSAGALVVASGRLTEDQVVEQPALVRTNDVRAAAGRGPDVAPHPEFRLASRTHRSGHGRSFGSYHIHQITNTGTQPAVSVHVYRPALQEMTRYELVYGRLFPLGVDRAGADW